MFTYLQSDKTPSIRGVLFDLDGVVIDTEKLFTRFWVEAANALGYPMTREQALQLRSLGRTQGQPKLESFFGVGVSYGAIRAERIRRMEAFIAEHGVEEKPGIRELLAYLNEHNIPCAITSSSSLEVIRRHLTNLGLAEGFTALCSGKDVPHGKPAPDIYLHGAACIGLRPEECLAIEDSPAGIESASRAGCHAVIVPDQDQPDEATLARCFAKADSLTDVMELLDNCSERGECMELADVLDAVKAWLRDVRTVHGRDLAVEVLNDSPSCLRVIFQTQGTLSELIVEEPGFAPYRFVAFTVMRVRADLNAEPAFCFYDDETCSVQDILRELDRGVRCAIEI